MSTTKNTLLVIGSGPGIGVHVAVEFAKHDFSNIILISRQDENLQRDKNQVIGTLKRSDLTVTTHQIDITDEASLKAILSKVTASSRIDCVLFNAARVDQSSFFEFSTAEIRQDFEVSTLEKISIRMEILTNTCRPQILHYTQQRAFWFPRC